MKFSRIVFTHPVEVRFTDEGGRPRDGFSNSVGTLCTYPNGTSSPVESIEAAGHWVLIRLAGQTKAVPAAKIDCCDVLESAAEPERRGPGRPPKDRSEAAA